MFYNMVKCKNSNNCYFIFQGEGFFKAKGVFSRASSDDQEKNKWIKTKAVGKSFFQQLGPGLITGASDDDPSGIVTYSKAGAQFGYGMLWTMLFSYPLMSVVQEISARVGRVTGQGIAGNIRHYYNPWLLYTLVPLLFLANVITLGADISAMGATLQLVIGGSLLLYVLIFSVISLILQILVPYTRYVKYLKWLTLALFSYIATVFVVHVPWSQAIRATFLPSLSFESGDLTMFIAVLGTTISPYLFFWQASQEVEEVKNTPGDRPLKKDPRQAPEQLDRIRFDTYIGMAVSNGVGYFIMLTAAVSLHSQGQTNVETATQAAQALEPVAGRFAFLLFAAGIIGTGLLAVPVLAGSAAYAVGEALKWPVGLERKPLEAKGFYGVLTVATLLGLAMNFFRINPIKALVWAAVINGIIAVPIMIVMMFMASDPKVMGKFTLSLPLKILGWITTLIMLAATLGLWTTWGR